MKKPVFIDDWDFYLEGTIRGRVRSSGKCVRTSPIVARDPETNTIMTKSGSLYRLGNQSGDSFPEETMWDDYGWLPVRKRIPRIGEKAGNQREETE